MQTYRIHRFSKLTGLSTHVIRAWERRYGLVTPLRGPNRYRLYNDEDVRLFRYLKSQVDAGMSIGELADIGREELLKRTKQSLLETTGEPPPSERLIGELLEAVEQHDRARFERKLNGALAVIPFEEALHRFLLPLQEQVGERWHNGQINVAQEHFVSSQVKQKIYSAINQLPILENGPKIIVACPAQEWHEISAMTVVYLCRARGCRVHYLGPNLPIPELAKYCERIQPTFVLLSITVHRTVEEAKLLAVDLMRHVQPIAPVGIGGNCAQTHATLLIEENIRVFEDLKTLDAFVNSLMQ